MPCSARNSERSARIRQRRVLFLDDDPGRAAAFLEENPHAVWVQTAAECVEQLSESWDEVHLDHDLGGKKLVDSSARDCGMEVIRWLCRESRIHLQSTHFLVHTHNLSAGLLMVLRMREMGYTAEFRPFGIDLEKVLAHNEPQGAGTKETESAAAEAEGPAVPVAPKGRWFDWMGALRGLWPGNRPTQ